MAVKEVLILAVADRNYGIQIGEIQGIENYIPPTEVADVPEYVSGIVSIREDIYPVIDLRKRLSLPTTDVTENTSYIVVNSQAGKVACTVDGVVEIYQAEENDVKDFPMMLRTEGTEYASCIVRAHGKLVLVIDSKHLLSDKDAKMITSAIAEKEAQEE